MKSQLDWIITIVALVLALIAAGLCWGLRPQTSTPPAPEAVVLTPPAYPTGAVTMANALPNAGSGGGNRSGGLGTAGGGGFAGPPGGFGGGGGSMAPRMSGPPGGGGGTIGPPGSGMTAPPGPQGMGGSRTLPGR